METCRSESSFHRSPAWSRQVYVYVAFGFRSQFPLEIVGLGMETSTASPSRRPSLSRQVYVYLAFGSVLNFPWKLSGWVHRIGKTDCKGISRRPFAGYFVKKKIKFPAFPDFGGGFFQPIHWEMAMISRRSGSLAVSTGDLLGMETVIAKYYIIDFAVSTGDLLGMETPKLQIPGPPIAVSTGDLLGMETKGFNLILTGRAVSTGDLLGMET